MLSVSTPSKSHDGANGSQIWRQAEEAGNAVARPPPLINASQPPANRWLINSQKHAEARRIANAPKEAELIRLKTRHARHKLRPLPEIPVRAPGDADGGLLRG
ncbi:MAG: hypothetical protein H6662_02880 [Ardenticatenaceae bacterium]|nr:hypothetical protein [Ardenticatenaceae bacterium]